MIHSFSVENFYSIRERMEIDFCSYDASSLGDWAVKSASGKQVSLVLGVFGENGSGKSNFLKALACCLHFMHNSFSDPVIIDQSWFSQEQVSKLSLIYDNEKGEIFKYDLHLLLG